MRKTAKFAARRLARFFNELVEAQLPAHIWLDASTLDACRTRR